MASTVDCNGARLMEMGVAVMEKSFFIDISTLKSVADAISNVVFIKDAESRFLILNKTGEEQWGLRHDDLYGTDPHTKLRSSIFEVADTLTFGI